MRLEEELGRRLPVLRDLCEEILPCDVIVERGEADVVHIGHVEEHVLVLDCLLALLVHSVRDGECMDLPPDQIDPLVQVSAHEVALQRVALDGDEALRRVVRPRREHDVAHSFGLMDHSHLNHPRHCRSAGSGSCCEGRQASRTTPV